MIGIIKQWNLVFLALIIENTKCDCVAAKFFLSYSFPSVRWLWNYEIEYWVHCLNGAICDGVIEARPLFESLDINWKNNQSSRIGWFSSSSDSCEWYPCNERMKGIGVWDCRLWSFEMAIQSEGIASASLSGEGSKAEVRLN